MCDSCSQCKMSFLIIFDLTLHINVRTKLYIFCSYSFIFEINDTKFTQLVHECMLASKRELGTHTRVASPRFCALGQGSLLPAILFSILLGGTETVKVIFYQKCSVHHQSYSLLLFHIAWHQCCKYYSRSGWLNT